MLAQSLFLVTKALQIIKQVSDSQCSLRLMLDDEIRPAVYDCDSSFSRKSLARSQRGYPSQRYSRPSLKKPLDSLFLFRPSVYPSLLCLLLLSLSFLFCFYLLRRNSDSKMLFLKSHFAILASLITLGVATFSHHLA